MENSETSSPGAGGGEAEEEEGRVASLGRRLKKRREEGSDEEGIRSVSKGEKKRKKKSKNKKKHDHHRRRHHEGGGEKKRKHKKKSGTSDSSRKKKKRRFLKVSAKETEEGDEEEEEFTDSGSDDESDASSSEEEAGIAEEMKGFIVSEEEDESGGEEEAGSDDSSEKDNEDEGPQQLDEEDLALIEENTGLTVRKQPLKIGEDYSDGETGGLGRGDEDLGSGPGDDLSGRRAPGDALSAERRQKYRRLKKAEAGKISGIPGVRLGDEGVGLGEGTGEYGVGRSVRERDGGPLFEDEDTRLAPTSSALQPRVHHAHQLQKAGRKTKKGRGATGGRDSSEEEDEEGWLEEDGGGRDSQQQRMNEAWGLVYDCFGDVDAVIRILCNQRPGKRTADEGGAAGTGKPGGGSGEGGDEDDEEREDADKKLPALSGRKGLPGKRPPGVGGWEEIGEPDEVKRDYLTAFDEHVRRVDEPERLYIRYMHRPRVTTRASLVLESRWVTARLFREFGPQLTERELQKRYFDAFFKSCHLRRSPQHDVRQKVLLLLHWLLNERLEVVFLLHHKLHLLAPPLTEEMIWRVYELDLQYVRLQARRRKVAELLEDAVDGVAILHGARRSEEARHALQVMWDQCVNEREKAIIERLTRTDGACNTFFEGTGLDDEEIALEDFKSYLHAHFRRFIVASRAAGHKDSSKTVGNENEEEEKREEELEDSHQATEGEDGTLRFAQNGESTGRKQDSGREGRDEEEEEDWLRGDNDKGDQLFDAGEEHEYSRPNHPPPTADPYASLHEDSNRTASHHLGNTNEVTTSDPYASQTATEEEYRGNHNYSGGGVPLQSHDLPRARVKQQPEEDPFADNPFAADGGVEGGRGERMWDARESQTGAPHAAGLPDERHQDFHSHGDINSSSGMHLGVPASQESLFHEERVSGGHVGTSQGEQLFLSQGVGIVHGNGREEEGESRDELATYQNGGIGFREDHIVRRSPPPSPSEASEVFASDCSEGEGQAVQREEGTGFSKRRTSRGCREEARETPIVGVDEDVEEEWSTQGQGGQISTLGKTRDEPEHTWSPFRFTVACISAQFPACRSFVHDCSHGSFPPDASEREGTSGMMPHGRQSTGSGFAAVSDAPADMSFSRETDSTRRLGGGDSPMDEEEDYSATQKNSSQGAERSKSSPEGNHSSLSLSRERGFDALDQNRSEEAGAARGQLTWNNRSGTSQQSGSGREGQAAVDPDDPFADDAPERRQEDTMRDNGGFHTQHFEESARRGDQRGGEHARSTWHQPPGGTSGDTREFGKNSFSTGEKGREGLSTGLSSGGPSVDEDDPFADTGDRGDSAVQPKAGLSAGPTGGEWKSRWGVRSSRSDRQGQEHFSGNRGERPFGDREREESSTRRGAGETEDGKHRASSEGLSHKPGSYQSTSSNLPGSFHDRWRSEGERTQRFTQVSSSTSEDDPFAEPGGRGDNEKDNRGAGRREDGQNSQRFLSSNTSETAAPGGGESPSSARPSGRWGSQGGGGGGGRWGGRTGRRDDATFSRELPQETKTGDDDPFGSVGVGEAPREKEQEKSSPSQGDRTGGRGFGGLDRVREEGRSQGEEARGGRDTDDPFADVEEPSAPGTREDTGNRPFSSSGGSQDDWRQQRGSQGRDSGQQGFREGGRFARTDGETGASRFSDWGRGGGGGARGGGWSDRGRFGRDFGGRGQYDRGGRRDEGGRDARMGGGREQPALDIGKIERRPEDIEAEAKEEAEWRNLEKVAEEEEREKMLQERQKKQRNNGNKQAAASVALRDIPGLEAVELADRYSLASLWESYLLPPEAFAANLTRLNFTSSSSSSVSHVYSELHKPAETPHIPLPSSVSAAVASTAASAASLAYAGRKIDPSPTDGLDTIPALSHDAIAAVESAVDAWCFPFCTKPLETGKQLRRLLVAYHAKILAGYPPLRALLRDRFRKICSLSTVTTAKGEPETDPAKACWMARRLCRLPLSTFLQDIIPEFEDRPPIRPWNDRASRKAEEERRKEEQREHLRKLGTVEEKREYLRMIQQQLKEQEENSQRRGPMARAKQLQDILKRRRDTRCLELFLQVHRLEKTGELRLLIHPQTAAETGPSTVVETKEFEERHRDFRRLYKSLVVDKGREAPAREAIANGRTAADAFGTGVGASLIFDLVKQKQCLDLELEAWKKHRSQDAFLLHRLLDDLLAAYTPQLWQSAAASNKRSGGMMHDAAVVAGAAPAWLYVQREILRRMVEVELLPVLKREIREELLHRAQQVVILRCRELLEWRLDTQPLRPSPEQIRQRQQQGEEDDDSNGAGDGGSRGRRNRRRGRSRAGGDTGENSSDVESVFGDGQSSESSDSDSSSTSSADDDDDDDEGDDELSEERRRQKAAKRQRRLQRKQRLLDRKRRLMQEPALLDVVAFITETIDHGLPELGPANVGSGAVYRQGRRAGSHVRVHAMLVNTWGEMEEYDRFEFLLNAPLPGDTKDGDENHSAAALQNASGGTGLGDLQMQRPFITPEQKRAQQDFERLLKLFKERWVDAAVVGVRDRFALLLYLILKQRLFPKLKKRHQPLFLELAKADVPIIWSGSDRVPDSLRQKFDREALMCLSLARMLQDPLAEIAGLWSEGRHNYLLQLKLHPLQHLVPADRLQSALERVLLTIVGRVGVDLRRALRGGATVGGNHCSTLLQFVPGLGPRKAIRLLGMFKTSTLLMRSQLCSPNDGATSDSDGGRGDLDDFYPSHGKEKRHAPSAGLGKKVYINCVSFLRLKNKTAADPDSVDALDDTRIHPVEGRGFVTKICRDAVENAQNEDEDDENGNGGEQRQGGGLGGGRGRDEEADDEDAIVEVLRKPALLDDMDLEAFAQMLDESEDQARSLPYLEFITSELRHPYKDPRLPFESPSEMEVFYWAINEDLDEFHLGASVSCQVLHVRNTSLVVKLQPSGIRVQLADLRELRSLLALRTQQKKDIVPVNQPGGQRQEDLSVLLGEVLQGRIALLHYGIELEASRFPTFRVEVVVTGDAVKVLMVQKLANDVSIKSLQSFTSPAARFDTLAVRKPLAVELEELQLQLQKQGQRLRRNIRHPNYKPVTPFKGLQLLQRPEVPVGEALFRPGSSSEGLTLMVKTCAEPFRCVSLPVEERNPIGPDDDVTGAAAAALQQQELGGLGRELILQGEKFDSLNAIIAQFCDPLRVNLEEVYRHPKFLPIPDLSFAAERLRQESVTRPGSICWAILPPTDGSSAQAPNGKDNNRSGSDNPLRFQLVVVPPQPPGAAAVGAARCLVDGIYVDHRKFTIWNQGHKSLQKLVMWWKEKGYWKRHEFLRAYAEEKARLQEERNRRKKEKEELKLLQMKQEEAERRTQQDYVAQYIQPRDEQGAREWFERALRRQNSYEPRAAGTVVDTFMQRANRNRGGGLEGPGGLTPHNSLIPGDTAGNPRGFGASQTQGSHLYSGRMKPAAYASGGLNSSPFEAGGGEGHQHGAFGGRGGYGGRFGRPGGEGRGAGLFQQGDHFRQRREGYGDSGAPFGGNGGGDDHRERDGRMGAFDGREGSRYDNREERPGRRDERGRAGEGRRSRFGGSDSGSTQRWRGVPRDNMRGDDNRGRQRGMDESNGRMEEPVDQDDPFGF
ncbi:transcription elongation factor [Cystoisospora suis]|uniref:Transcription elongation factor n=1 Tax=Cystoisospora suis TaxID=483139 RepID=A0A2C6L6K6_9APIC|nr:transcription elongation factor [Cystoisospora suis]